MENYQKLSREQLKNVTGGVLPPEYHYYCYCWSQDTGKIEGTGAYYKDDPSVTEAGRCSPGWLACETFNPIDPS
ncbi:hypothetical protein VRU48_12175 [Pedobacter sp. KR3-3]|uniref:Bacteriocin-type signal sequence-containing protein n=1 Tax=Pedobacter albus TaxID=3113905 RepID=A0ABU7I8S0_9SPHI|nr:hypothetical protein [Pedobacter sp. KR3-3]MEE1945868.1 hypothetical protein [Pedobacter sp. KR3-3]